MAIITRTQVENAFKQAIEGFRSDFPRNTCVNLGAFESNINIGHGVLSPIEAKDLDWRFQLNLSALNIEFTRRENGTYLTDGYTVGTLNKNQVVDDLCDKLKSHGCTVVESMVGMNPEGRVKE